MKPTLAMTTVYSLLWGEKPPELQEMDMQVLRNREVYNPAPRLVRRAQAPITAATQQLMTPTEVLTWLRS